MAKHDTDPVLRQLVHAVNESRQAGVPVTVSTHGTVLTGLLSRGRDLLRRPGRGQPAAECPAAILGPAR